MRHGDPRLPPRFWSKVYVRGACWEWLGANTGAANAYGVYFTGGVGSRAANKRQYRRAHRVAYEAMVGPVPDGLQLDHLCRVTLCVNPAHLEPVTQRENVIRGRAPAVAGLRNANKTHCSRGHEYSGDNLRIGADGYRYCRACKREYEAKYKAKRTAVTR